MKIKVLSGESDEYVNWDVNLNFVASLMHSLVIIANTTLMDARRHGAHFSC